MRVKVGCCGFAVRGGKKAYYERFKLVEVQQTFYKLPRPQTAQRWRSQAPQDFEFTVKCWQAVTHPPTSPTWRKAGVKVPEEKKDKYGFLRPTEENFEAWEATAEICKALRARICVIQCPPSFRFTPENVENVKAFFGSIDRHGLLIAWEPRADWREHLDVVRGLCEELDLIYTTDVLRHGPLVIGPIFYTRLHGLAAREFDYRYKYTDEDLARLVDILLGLEEEGVEEAYVLFNNIYMAEDASRLLDILAQKGLAETLGPTGSS